MSGEQIVMTREEIMQKMISLIPEKYKNVGVFTFRNIKNDKLNDSEILAKREINRLYYYMNRDKIKESNRKSLAKRSGDNYKQRNPLNIKIID
jgi:hypothetical protein